jgi:hypothetical protein
MSTRRTPPLSAKASEEVREELRNPPADTPERRTTFDRADAAAFLVRLALSQPKVKRVG